MDLGERLVGRANVKAAVAAALDEARSGGGLLLLIGGEAGIGKSAVLSYLAEAAREDCRVLRGFCLAGSGVPPYWPWIQVLRATGVAAGHLGEAGRLLDTTSGAADPNGALAAADARFRLHDAIGRVLTMLAVDRPVVVMLDDLHWADEQSLAVLPFLTRAIAADRVLIVGAYRDTEAPPALLDLTGGAHHIQLTGLTLTEAQAMVGSLPGTTPPPDLTTQVWRRSAGNPFFVRELTRLIQAQGNDRLPGHLPAGIIETVRRRLARLPSDSARLLDWAAVAGRDIDVPLLVHAGAAADEPTGFGLLLPARRAGVVTTDDPPRFTHDLFRDAVLDAMPQPTAETRNLAIARALQARSGPGDAARIAAHLLAAGPSARADAVEFSVRAARDATARLGHDDACAHTCVPCRCSTMPTRGGSSCCWTWPPHTIGTARSRRPAPATDKRRRSPTRPGTGRRWPGPRSDCKCSGTGRRPPSTTSCACCGRPTADSVWTMPTAPCTPGCSPA